MNKEKNRIDREWLGLRLELAVLNANLSRQKMNEFYPGGIDYLALNYQYVFNKACKEEKLYEQEYQQESQAKSM